MSSVPYSKSFKKMHCAGKGSHSVRKQPLWAWLPFSSYKVLPLGYISKQRVCQLCSSKAQATKPGVSPAGGLGEQILKLQPRPAESWSLGAEHRNPYFSETPQLTARTRQVGSHKSLTKVGLFQHVSVLTTL